MLTTIPEPRRPLPDAAGHRAWQTVPKLTRDQNKLAAMVAFVGNEIRQTCPTSSGRFRHT